MTKTITTTALLLLALTGCAGEATYYVPPPTGRSVMPETRICADTSRAQPIRVSDRRCLSPDKSKSKSTRWLYAIPADLDQDDYTRVGARVDDDYRYTGPR